MSCKGHPFLPTLYTLQTTHFVGICLLVCMHTKSFQSCQHLCDSMDCNQPGSSFHGILQARILEGVAMPSSRGSSQPRDRIRFSYTSCSGKGVLYQQHHLASPFRRWRVDLEDWISWHQFNPNIQHTLFRSDMDFIFFSFQISFPIFSFPLNQLLHEVSGRFLNVFTGHKQNLDSFR